MHRIQPGRERMLVSIEAQKTQVFDELNKKRIYLAPLEDSAQVLGVIREQALKLREQGFRIETAAGVFSLSQHLKKANQAKARYALIAGPDEIQKGQLVIKDLEKREQVEVEFDKVADYFVA